MAAELANISITVETRKKVKDVSDKYGLKLYRVVDQLIELGWDEFIKREERFQEIEQRR